MKQFNKIYGIIACSVLLTGCSKLFVPGTPVLHHAEATADPVATATPTPKPVLNNKESINPNTVTDYDREAVLILINNDLSVTYGGNIASVSSNEVNMSKEGGVLTVTGNYYHMEDYQWVESGLTYVYKDRNEFYELVSKDIGASAQEIPVKQAQAPDTAGMTPTSTYDVYITNSVDVTLTTDGGGFCIVKLVDASGNVVSEMLNAENPFETTVSATVAEAGNYTIELYLTGGWAHINYSTN